MKNIILLILVFGSHFLFAQQTDSLNNQEIISIKNDISDQNKKLYTLNKKLSNAENEIEMLSNTSKSQRNKIARQQVSISDQNNKISEILKLTDSLSGALKETQLDISKRTKSLKNDIDITQKNTNSEITNLNLSIETNKLYWILGFVVIIFLGGIIYIFLNKKILMSEKNSETQIKKTKKSLEDETIKLDNKLIELLDSQLKVNQEERRSNPKGLAQESDHSLALKVADEIIRLEKNLTRMDQDVKGLKQLTASVNRIKDNFASNGYEIIEMLGKEYNEGMKVTANFVPDESLEEGKQIISRIIKPQVNFNNTMIQAAQIEVSIGE